MPQAQARTDSGYRRASPSTTRGQIWVADVLNNRVMEFKPPFTDGMNASLELGHAAGGLQFMTSTPSVGPNGLNSPVDMKFDPSGDLWISDRGNNRVMEFKPPFTDGMNASSVVGQVDLSTVAPYISPSESSLFGPNGIAFDSSGNLWVADENFNRVLEFAAASLGGNDPPAVLELGQRPGASQFSSEVSADNRSGLYAPLSPAFDPSGDLWVSDRIDNRVLEFVPPFTDGMNASNEIGQPAGSGAFTANSTGLTQSSLNNPLGISFDTAGDLWVSDQLNNRVLEFSGAALTTAGINVDVPTTSAVKNVGVASNGNTCYQMAEQTICHVAVNQTSTTGVEADMIGVASASTANVYTADLGSKEPVYAEAAQGLVSSPIAFYEIAVWGIGNGTATVCIDQPNVQPSTQMAYFSGRSWGSPTSTSRSVGKSICGTIPLSVVASRPALIAVGSSNGSVTLPGSSSGVYLILFFGAIIVCGFAVMVWRRGRSVETWEEMDEDES